MCACWNACREGWTRLQRIETLTVKVVVVGTVLLVRRGVLMVCAGRKGNPLARTACICSRCCCVIAANPSAVSTLQLTPAAPIPELYPCIAVVRHAAVVFSDLCHSPRLTHPPRWITSIGHFLCHEQAKVWLDHFFHLCAHLSAAGNASYDPPAWEADRDGQGAMRPLRCTLLYDT